jgi:hypothetical protein
MALARKFKFFPDIVSIEEKRSEEKELDYSLPNSLAYLINCEFSCLKKYTEIRKAFQQYYIENLDKKFTILDNQNIGNAFRVCLICKTKVEKDNIHIYMKNK